MLATSKRKLIFAAMLLIAVTATAQTIPALERIVTISFFDQTEEEALRKLSTEAKVTFSYSPSVLDKTRKITLSFRARSVRQILESVFESRLQFRQKGNYIILTKKPIETKPTSSVKIVPFTITGYVIDGTTGAGVEEASIYDKVSLESAITNAYGYFSLPLEKAPGATVVVSVSKKNYRDTTVSFSVTNSFTNIKLFKAAKSRDALEVSQTISNHDSVALTNSVNKQDTVYNHPIVDAPNPVKKKKLSWGRLNMFNIKDSLYRRFQISFVPFVGTNRKLSGNVVNDYSFNVLGGIAMANKVVDVGGLFNINRGDAGKFQLAGIFNNNGGSTAEWQTAGLFNMNQNGESKLQLGGLANVNMESGGEVQIAGVTNFNKVDAGKVQLGGIANINLGSSEGLQMAGLFNVNGSKSGSVQFAGLGNVQVGSLKGVQVAGVFNFVSKELEGTQVAGLINYSKRVKGVQIGIFNWVDSLEGVSVGLLSFVSKGYHKLEISADEIFYTNISFRTGVHRLYNIITAGIKPGVTDNFWTVGYGFGTAPRISRTVRLNIDLTANQVSLGQFTKAVNLVNKLYVGTDIQLARKFSIAAGVTLNAYVTENSYSEYPDLFTDYVPNIIYDHDYKGANVKMWLGGKVGLRFF